MMKKRQQLGMGANTATGRLVRDLLFNFVVKDGHKCYRCGLDLDRETFSIDHKIDWLDSDNPVSNFFNIDNIAFSHLSCNKKAPRKDAKDKVLRSRKPEVVTYMKRYYQEVTKKKRKISDL
jgi:hypothetical protein